jgi:Uma2 family endonuclease
MSAVLEQPQRYAVSAEEYLRMGAAGVFAPDARLELIEGEIVTMPPIGSPRAGTVNISNKLFIRLADDAAVVSIQHPLILGDRSVPEPDLVLLRPRTDSYTNSHPTVADVLLVVEVSDSSLKYDLGTKIPLYARLGVPESWIFDVQERVIRVFRDPSASGYRTSFTIEGETTVTSLLLPQVVVSPSTVFAS